MLPIAQLFELDGRMTRPLRPRLKRPQQKSFPHINGLYLLLRATQLGVPEGNGKISGQLKLDVAMHRQWLQLNATERYFNLLEAWLRRASWEAIGQRTRGWTSCLAIDVRDHWMWLPSGSRGMSGEKRLLIEFWCTPERSCTLALLELFGLVSVEREEPEEGQSWRIVEVRRTPFGEELLKIVFDQTEQELFDDQMSAVAFGAWQASLRPYFPQWVNNLKLPEPESRDGTFYFKVALGKPWRRIAIPAKATLGDLAECIIDAFDFDGDHLYAFEYRARDGCTIRIDHPYVDDAGANTDEITVGELPLEERQSMGFQYDFGTDWRFDVRLEKIDPEGGKIKKPTIVESKGEAPPEYDFDDDEW